LTTKEGLIKNVLKMRKMHPSVAVTGKGKEELDPTPPELFLGGRSGSFREAATQE